MVDTAVRQENACGKCGAEIRPDSLFCYACGSELSKPPTSIAEPSGNGGGVRRPGSEPPALRSAASIKRERSKSKSRQIEVVWEPADDYPGPLFVAATAAVVVVVLIIVVLATYFK